MTKYEKHEVDFFALLFELFFIPEFYELTHRLNRNIYRKKVEIEALYRRENKKRIYFSE
jgi:hypothetical protein